MILNLVSEFVEGFDGSYGVVYVGSYGSDFCYRCGVSIDFD